MSAAADLQAHLRFLSQDAKVPLAIAMGKVKELQKAELLTVEALAKTSLDRIRSIFIDEKLSKQIHNAAKRVSKKRTAGEETGPTAKRQRKQDPFSMEEQSPQQIESALILPYSTEDADALMDVVLFTNRAPLVLAIAVTLLKYTMPQQPLSSRLSLAQAYVSVSSRGKAVYLGLESGRSAQEEGYGEGQPIVKLMGRDIRVLRRWGYEWKPSSKAENDEEDPTQEMLRAQSQEESNQASEEQPTPETTPFWAIDLEALKKSNRDVPVDASFANGDSSALPIYSPHSARAYLMKSFDTAPPSTEQPTKKKPSAAVKMAEKERNLGMLLRALDLLFQTWADSLDADKLDQRANTWYFKIRPQVDQGVAGWGGKNTLKLADILNLRKS